MTEQCYVFKRESNNFDDILSDTGLKKHIREKVRWYQHLLISFKTDVGDQTIGYMVLKYGDDLTRPYEHEYKPMMGKDYIPDIERSRWTKVKLS